MKFGLAFASSIAQEHEDSLEVCRRADAAGFESLWGGEHVILPSTIDSKYPYTTDGKIPAEPETPIPDPLIWLAFAAAAAPTMRPVNSSLGSSGGPTSKSVDIAHPFLMRGSSTA